ncbi:SAM-dependent methyltransferase [Clostridium sp. WILCCON 0269]|uniref:S-adenosyl-L-methionine-dependent methyltransferase n=1 Tax=Candidatus Clostridium eludens TaxID=3381663 RepID=A0ABW8SRD6_9CLOT
MARAAAKTGADPTVMVAIEQYFPKKERIIEDGLAYGILPFGRSFVWLARFNSVRNWMVRAAEKSFPGLWGCMMCRKRYIDEKLMESVNNINAVVNLGTGFDTRAYRLPELSKIPVWELDQLKNIKPKQIRLIKVFGAIPSHVKLAPIDFDTEDICTILKLHGYSTDERTFFIWEAVTQYLTEEGIRATFDFLAKASSGSRLAFTYVRKDFIEGRARYGWDKIYEDYVTKNIWIFGMEPGAWPSFLKEYGWRIIEDIGYDEMAEKYVKPTGRILISTPVERMVYAEKL